MPNAATIWALSSGRPPAGLAVFRASGPAAAALLKALTGQPPGPARRAQRRLFHHPQSGGPIDDGLALWFPAPASFTGEDVVEIHVHGGPAVVQALLTAGLAVPGVRLAEAGEFTRRAFDHGKLDLTQIEGLADLIAAETEAQRMQALAQSQGALSRLYGGWRTQLIAAMARVEADLDFADGEDDVPAGLGGLVQQELTALRHAMAKHLADGRRGERLRDALTIVVAGAPNAGKSSLMNRLTQRDVAIVARAPGTTRDVLEAHLDFGGYPVVLIDTAGLRDTDDPVEAEGVRRARARVDAADLILQVQATDALSAPLAGAWTVWNKIDLGSAAPDCDFAVSALSGAGLEALTAALADWAAAQLRPGGGPVLTRARHRDALERCLASLGEAQEEGVDLVLVAEALRHAAHALGCITGRVDVEDVLDDIFRSFCIGK